MYDFLLVIVTALATIVAAISAWLVINQTRLQSESVKHQLYVLVMQRLEETRMDRALIRNYVSQKKVEIPPARELDDAANRVCREFDFLGLLDRNKMLDPRLVDQFYSVAFVKLYDDFLKDYVKHLRDDSRRGKTHFWELVEFYERVKKVPSKHPGLSGLSDWPPGDLRT